MGFYCTLPGMTELLTFTAVVVHISPLECSSSQSFIANSIVKRDVTSQLVTSEHITKPPVVIFFYLHADQVASDNTVLTYNYGKRAYKT